MRRSSDSFWGLERPIDGRLLMGVCIGVAERAAIDVTLVRLGFLLLGLASGIGILIYLLLWLLLPQAGSAQVSNYWTLIQLNLRRIPQDLGRAGQRLGNAWQRCEQTPWPRPLTRRWIGLGLIGAGLLVMLYSLGLFDWLGPARLIALLAIIGGAALLINLQPQWRR